MERIRKSKRLLKTPPKKRRSLCKSHPCLQTDCLAFAVLIGLFAMLVTWGSSSVVNAGYELMESRICLEKIERQHVALRMEVAQLKSPQRIQDIAVGQLGMTMPEVIYVREKNSVGRRTVK